MFRTFPVAIVAALALGLTPSAHAQLGALRRKAEQAASGAVESKLPFTPLPAPEFNDWVLEITPERLVQVLKGFDAEVAAMKTAKAEYEARVKSQEEAMAGYERARAAHEKESQRYIACRDKWEEAEEKARSANEEKIQKPIEELDDDQVKARYERLFKQGEKFGERAEAGTLDPANDPELQAWAREMQVVQAEMQRRSMAIMAGMRAEQERQRTADPRLVAACGARPITPERPDDWVSGPEGILMEMGATTASLQKGQRNGKQDLVRRYAIIRERILHYAQSRGRPTGMGFSPDEMAALNGKSRDLNAAVDRMQKAKVPL